MAVAIIPEEKGIVGLLDSEAARKIIEPMLSHGSDYRRVIQEVYLAVKDNPELLECEPASIVRAVGRAVSWGLVIGETVHLVPFNVKVSKRGEPDRWAKRCKALQDYKGKIEMIVRSGSARAIDAEDVYEHDDFLLELGAHPICRLRPVLDPKKRGAYLGTYAVARLAGGLIKVIWVAASEVETIRQKHSKQWKSGDQPYWYGPKTAIHRIAKELPKSDRLAKVLGAFREDDDEEEGESLEAIRVVTLGGAPARIQGDHPKPVATSGVEPYDEAPRTLNEGPVQPQNMAAIKAAIKAADNEDPYTGERFAELDFSNEPFPETLP